MKEPLMRKAVMIAVLVALVGAAALAARGQSTLRPGEPTQATVLVQNRNPNEAIPVVVQSIATPVTAHLDSSSTVQTVVARQAWEYRTVTLGADVTPGPEIQRLGTEGWEAVGVVTSGTGRTAVLLKRPR